MKSTCCFRRIAAFTLAVCAILAPLHQARSQSIEELIKSLGVESIARDYLRPGADAVGYSFNSGLYNTARVEGGFHVWLGVRGMATFIPESDQSFTTVLPTNMVTMGYTPVTTATITGKTGATLRAPNYPDVKLPDGIGQKNIFLMLPHLTIGSLLGTEIMIRGIPKMTFETEVGRIGFIGVGAKHSPTNYIRLPFDIAVMAAIQRFTIADVMTVNSEAAHVIASLPLGMLTVYGGIGYETYSIDLTYTYTPPAGTSLPPELNKPVTITTNFNRHNLRTTVGANLKLIPLIDLSVDYSFGIQDNFTAGIGFSF